MIEAGFGENELGIDWGTLWENVPHDLGFDFVDQPNSGCSLTIDEIEQYLLDDKCGYAEKEDQIVIEDRFSPDMLLDLSPRSKDSSPSPDSTGTDPEGKDEDKQREVRVDDGLQISDNHDAIVGADADDADNDDDPDSKKRKRQMRNRDAAVRSRERKKMYVKDLEMKSKFYEAECKRLGMLFQSCVAENQALRFALHNSKAFDSSSRTRQESAVLLLESLLLGSLLGHLGIFILCLATQFPTPQRRSWDRRNLGGNDTCFSTPTTTTSTMGKKYRGSRSKMKRLLLCMMPQLTCPCPPLLLTLV